jgi:hypothetical protein
VGDVGDGSAALQWTPCVACAMRECACVYLAVCVCGWVGGWGWVGGGWVGIFESSCACGSGCDQVVARSMLARAMLQKGLTPTHPHCMHSGDGTLFLGY